MVGPYFHSHQWDQLRLIYPFSIMKLLVLVFYIILCGFYINGGRSRIIYYEWVLFCVCLNFTQNYTSSLSKTTQLRNWVKNSKANTKIYTVGAYFRYLKPCKFSSPSVRKKSRWSTQPLKPAEQNFPRKFFIGSIFEEMWYLLVYLNLVSANIILYERD